MKKNMKKLILAATFLLFFATGAASAQTINLQPVDPNFGEATWSHVAIGEEYVYFTFHSGQEVFLSTYDRETMQLLHTQKVNVITKGVQDECKIEICDISQNVGVFWSDRSSLITEYMESNSRYYAPGGIAITGEVPLSSATTTSWRPLPNKRIGGGFIVTYTSEWGEDAFVREVSSNGALLQEHLVNSPISALGKSQNYSDVFPARAGAGGLGFIAVHMESYQDVQTNFGGSFGDGRQPRLARGWLGWQADNESALFMHRWGPFGMPVGSKRILHRDNLPAPFTGYRVRDLEMNHNGSITVFEARSVTDNSSYILISNDNLQTVQQLTENLGATSNTETDRRTPNVYTSADGQLTIFACSGRLPGQSTRKALWGILD
jgi:hypothetical protein